MIDRLNQVAVRLGWLCVLLAVARGGVAAAGSGSALLRHEKRGLCLALADTVCRLPLETQLYALNTAFHFAEQYGYRFVGGTPHEDSRSRRASGGGAHGGGGSCALLTTLFQVEAATLRHRADSILPTFRLKCDPRMFVPPATMCPRKVTFDSKDKPSLTFPRNASNVWCGVPEYSERGESERRCLPSHMALASVSATKLTLKSLLGGSFRPPPDGDDKCVAVLELDPLSLLTHQHFGTTRSALQLAFRRDTVCVCQESCNSEQL
jgi:hypothetical protein